MEDFITAKIILYAKKASGLKISSSEAFFYFLYLSFVLFFPVFIDMTLGFCFRKIELFDQLFLQRFLRSPKFLCRFTNALYLTDFLAKFFAFLQCFICLQFQHFSTHNITYSFLHRFFCKISSSIFFRLKVSTCLSLLFYFSISIYRTLCIITNSLLLQEDAPQADRRE